MISHDNGLWRILCLVNEKGPAMPEKPVFPWEIIYMGNPHVPNDFDKIGHAAIFARQSSCETDAVFAMSFRFLLTRFSGSGSVSR